MTEQIQTEIKERKPGLLRQILWWVWVILLAILLLLGLVFAAPWKVLALFIIFLAAATIMPRAYRKWFWLGVGIVIIALVVWIFLPEDNEGWRPYTFDAELAKLQAKYAVPDSENAAIIYNQIFKNWKLKEANEPNLPDDWFDLARKGPWSNNDQPEIAAYIQYHRDAIEQLVQASKLDQCSFPVIADAFVLGEQMERISTMRPWAYLLIAAANNDMAEGKTNEAIEKYLAVVKMSRHLSRQQSVIEKLVCIAIEALGSSGVDRFVVLGDANELYLSRFEQAVTDIKHDWNTDLTGFIDNDKLMFKNRIGELFYEVNSKGNIRFSHDPYARIREKAKNRCADVNVVDADFFSGYWFKKIFKAYTILYWFYMPQTPEKLGKIVDAAFEKHSLMTKPDFDWSKEKQNEPTDYISRFKLNLGYLAKELNRKELTRINRGSYASLHDYFLRSSSRQKGTLLIIALRRYKNANGLWPEKLEDINNIAPAEIFVDPLNKGTFVYKRIDDGFTLYSKGKNGIDEEGELSNKGCDDWVIWPRGKAAKTQQEKADAEQQ